MKSKIRSTSITIALSLVIALSACGEKKSSLSPEAQILVTELQTEMKKSDYTKEEKELIKQQIEEIKSADLKMNVLKNKMESEERKAELAKKIEAKKIEKEIGSLKMDEVLKSKELKNKAKEYLDLLGKDTRYAVERFGPHNSNMTEEQMKNLTFSQFVKEAEKALKKERDEKK